MMRLQRLSPEILPLTNATNLNGNSIIPGLTSFESVPLKPKSSDSPIRSISFDSDSIPTPSQLSNKTLNEVGVGRGNVLLQWGRKKRSRGARPESRNGEEQTSPLQPRRQIVKVRRRSAIVAAQKVAAVSMPPPSTIRSGNLRPSLVSRNSVGRMFRTVEDRTVGPTRSDNRSSQSPAGKSQKTPFTSDCDAMNLDSKQPSEEATTTASASERITLDKFEWPRIYLSLSRKEKEDDFLAMKGTKLPQRPKKRSKNVDKSLQYCFPGMWLSELTKARYEVREKKCVKKKVRGLKGMESSMDSDSE